MGDVKINLADGALGGVITTLDGIAGMVVTGVAEGSIALGTPLLITSLLDATTAGLTSANNALAYKQVSDFYLDAALGSQLYLMLVAATMKVNQMADKTNANGAIKLLNYAGGKVRLLGIMSNDAAVYTGGTTLVQTNGINADVLTAIVNMQALADQFFAQQQPFRAVIGGTSFNGTAANLSDLTQQTNSRVSVVIGDTVSGAGACVGLVLGSLATVPVQRKISRVKSGALPIATAFIGTVSADAYSQYGVIASKGYITFKTYVNKSGFYFTGDPTATATSDDYSSIARGRVIDKAHVLAYATFVEEVDDEVPIDPDTGLIDSGFIKSLEQSMENQINLAMVANQECSGATCFIDASQPILSTNKLNSTLKVTPVGYSTNVEIYLSFSR